MAESRHYIFRIAILTATVVFLGLTPLVKPSAAVALYDLKRLMQIGLLLVVAGAVALVPYGREAWIRTWRSLPVLARACMVAVVVAGLVSSLAAADPHHALLEVTHLVLLIVLSLAVASVVQQDPETARKLILWVVYAGALVYTVFVVRDYLFSQLDLSYAFRKGQINALWPNGEYLGYAHPRFLNQVQSIVIPLLALPALWADRRSRSSRWILLLVCILWWTMVFATGSRGTLLSCGFALVISGMFFWRTSRRYYLSNIAAFVVGLAVFILLFKILGETAESIDQRQIATSSERLNLWRHAFMLFSDQPLLGVGPMHYAKFHHSWGVHPHSAPIQLLSEWGLAAAITAATLIVLGLFAMGRYAFVIRRSGDPHALHAAVSTSVLAGLAHSSLSGVLVMPASQIAFALVVGVATGLVLVTKTGDTSRVDRAGRPSAAVILIVAILLVAPAEVYLAQRSFVGREVRRESASNFAQEHRRLPRFWLWGCISDYSVDNRPARHGDNQE